MTGTLLPKHHPQLCKVQCNQKLLLVSICLAYIRRSPFFISATSPLVLLFCQFQHLVACRCQFHHPAACRCQFQHPAACSSTVFYHTSTHTPKYHNTPVSGTWTCTLLPPFTHNKAFFSTNVENRPFLINNNLKQAASLVQCTWQHPPDSSLHPTKSNGLTPKKHKHTGNEENPSPGVLNTRQQTALAHCSGP